MKIRTGILITILAMGCGSEEAATGELENAAEQIEAAAAAAGEAVEGAAEAEAAAEGAAATAEGAAGAAGAAGAEGAEGMQQGLAALGEALAAAQGAEGGTHCEQAYNGAMAMVAALQKQGGNSPQAGNIPSQESFLEGCNALPEQAQQCMTMSYAMANQETCGTVMQSPEVQAFRAQMRPQ